MRRRRNSPFRSAILPLAIVAGLVVLAYLIFSTVNFINQRNRLPRGTTLSDVDIGELEIRDAISKTNRALQAPVFLQYQTQNITFAPTDINYQLDETATQTQLTAVVQANNGFENLPKRLLQQDIAGTQLLAIPKYNATKLDAFLASISERINRTAQPALPNLASNSVAPGTDGLVLNIAESKQLLLAALASPVSRTVQLVADPLPQSQVSVAVLRETVQQRLAAFTQVEGNVAGVFVKDLQTGEELSINADLPYSAQGWLKLALLLETYRLTADPMPPPVAQQLEAIALQGNNATANELLRVLGQGDANTGVNQLNDTLRKLGLLSTFLAQPFGQDGLAVNVITPANSRPDAPATNPNPNAQSTLIQVGTLLETIELCRNGAGALPFVFSGAFTPNKCTQLIDLLTRNRLNALIETGSPNASVAHRQSWDEFNHGDAALVRTAGRTYIIVIMLHSKSTLSWQDTSVTMTDISRLVYGLFNGVVPPASAGIATAPAP